MRVTIAPRDQLAGIISSPSSKAQTHRALFAGLLTNGTTTVRDPLASEDTEATTRAIVAAGAEVVKDSDTWTITSIGRPIAPEDIIDCGESGVTMRFTIPILSLTGSRATLRGRESLLRRPIEPLSKAMRQLGIELTLGRDHVTIEGETPKGGTIRIQGDVSSQFVSGLLFAGPLMEKGMKLIITSKLESQSYVSLTIRTMREHGIEVTADKEMTQFDITPGQVYLPAEHRISGDYSSAAFFLIAAAITNSRLLVHNLQPNSLEPDSELIKFMNRMGTRTIFQNDGLQVERGTLRGVDLDISDCPDLGPIVAVLACFAQGQTRITGAARLRYKESDRLAAISSELSTLGADIKETQDGLVLEGPSSLRGGTVQSHGDHRIAMALGVAALRANGKVTIEQAESVSKSYPRFFDDLRSLGVEISSGQ
ncbi:MAG TPA: 3-phosphoshikimate 1-carboxyvinyltransferase [Candidatus Acidoferrum sp.]|nr:3-phosphoshikimate 1-carboxyvinyltransferase [Candidatus Acidoferrum sp.]